MFKMIRKFIKFISKFFYKKYFSDFHAISDYSLPLKKRNSLKLKLGMYSSVCEKDIKNLVDLFKFYILKQDLKNIELCVNKFEKSLFISKKNKLIILTMIYPYFKDRAISYAEKYNIFYILSYSNSTYIDFNPSVDRFFLKINSCNKYLDKQKILNDFMGFQGVSHIYFNSDLFNIKVMSHNSIDKICGDKVSIILTVHNCIDYIETSIKSILNQDYVNFELIIVDDASNDGTIDILKNYKSIDDRIKLILLDQNVGTYNARNIALKYSEGEYYAFQDADDYSHMSRLSQSIRVLEANEKLIAVSSKYIRISEDGYFISSKGIPLVRWSPLTLVFRKVVVEKLQGFDTVRFGADSEFFYRMIINFGAHSHLILDKVLMFCLDRDNSLMKKNINFFGFSKDRNIYRDTHNHMLHNTLDKSK